MREFSIIQFGSEPYLHYWCKHCTEECLNELTADRTRHRECATCHDLPVLEEKQPIDRVVPSLRWATIATQQFSLPPQSTASEQRSGCPSHIDNEFGISAPGDTHDGKCAVIL